MKTKKQYINLLRILAAICITNSHFANIWPVSAIASGGMLGDVLFFAISGYGLCHQACIGKNKLQKIIPMGSEHDEKNPENFIDHNCSPGSRLPNQSLAVLQLADCF